MIPHIQSLYSTSWVAWTMLFLAMCLLVGEMSHRGYLINCLASLLGPLERRYDGVPRILTVVLLLLFCFGVSGMSLYLSLYQSGEFSWMVYFKMIGLVAAMLVVREVILQWVGYVCSLGALISTIHHQYLSFWVLLSLLLWGMALWVEHSPRWLAYRWLWLIPIALYGLFWFWKLIRTFYKSSFSWLYILLYGLTAEFLPFAGMMIVAQKIL